MTDDKRMQDSASLASLAEHLGHDLDHILKRWFAEVTTSIDETLVEAISRKEFFDSIPDFLEHFCARLRGDDARPTAPARQHGAHRWQQGLSFTEVIHEWSLLHRILIERIGDLWADSGLTAESLPRVYAMLAEIIEQAIETSLSEYHARLRAHADARVHDLELVLSEHEDRDRVRGQGLQQASHDLRGGLQTVQISCYLLKNQNLDKDTRVLVERLAQAGESLNHLLTGLLDLARIEAGRESYEASNFDAAKLLRELAAANQPQADAKGIEMIVRGDETLKVRTDAAKIRRIAQNLILNALAYTAEGIVEIGWYADPPRNWLFYIRDSGPGMALARENPLAANLAQAGRGAAMTTDSAAHAARSATTSLGTKQSLVHGEGIGLSIVHRLCELLDAVLEIDSESGNGTVFRVQLPFDTGNPSSAYSDANTEQ